MNGQSLLTCASTGLLLACTADAERTSSTETPHDSLAIELAIGGIDEERPEYEFARIYGIVGTRDGGVIIADHQNHILRVYDANGTHRYNIGREGAGPGELRGPCCLAFDPHDRLWVRDGGNSRYNSYQLFDDSAHFITQRRMAHSDVNRVAPLTFDTSGALIDIGARSDEKGNRVTARVHLDSTSAILRQEIVHEPPQDSTGMKSVQRPTPQGGFIIQYGRQPYGPEALYAHGPGGEFAHALSSRYAIDWRDAHGQLLRHITYDLPQGPPLSERERAAADRDIDEQAKWMNVSRTQLGFDVPAHKPPLRNIFFDRDGRLWVQLAVADGANPTAHLYDHTGQLERTVSWPRRVNLSHGAVQGDIAWAIATDSLDVPAIVRLRKR